MAGLYKDDWLILYWYDIIKIMMKSLFRKLFSPLLALFESGTGEYVYQESHRKILIIFGVIFTSLASFVLYLAWGQDSGYLFPVIIFGAAGIVSLIIGWLGSDRAVSKIWGSK